MSTVAYSLKDAAAAVGQSVDTLRRALKATDPQTFPPPLKGKKDGRGRYFISAKELDRWFDSLEDA